jgi:hypothetical protein
MPREASDAENKESMYAKKGRKLVKIKGIREIMLEKSRA